MKLATFGAGCFWGVEHAFIKSGRVASTRVGYMGGSTGSNEQPVTYKQVCSGNTGHAEVVEVTYDPATTSYKDLLAIFWNCHDPTQLNRQGPDYGTQYRSVIFYHDPEQEGLARESMQSEQTRIGRRIVTQIVPASAFYPAEEYHQKYLIKRGKDQCHL